VASRRTVISDEDEAALWALALVEGTTVAEQRRRAIRAYAKRARRDPHIAELVQINVERKRRREREAASNVIPLRRNHG
jgi:hypothetical protein